MTVYTTLAMASVNSKGEVGSFINNSSDSHVEERTNSSGDKCINDFSANHDVLSYAEILYKCTLCRSLPSILTSEDNFRVHMRTQHLSGSEERSKDNGETCGVCKLRFKTKEDLQCHTVSTHSIAPKLSGKDNIMLRKDVKESKEISSKKSTSASAFFHMTYQSSAPKAVCTSNVALTSSDVIDVKPTLAELMNACSEALNLKGKRIGPTNTDHSVPLKSGVLKSVYFPSDKTQQTSSDSLCRLQELTDQIMASSRSVTEKRPVGGDVREGESVRHLPTPGFTQEFGKYTKLVREGGNIVYFCQVCNWKSPSKPDFQAHCSGHAHRAKFRLATKSGHDCCELSTEQSKEGCRVSGDKSICVKVTGNAKEMSVGKFSPINVLHTPVCTSHRGLMDDLSAGASGPNERPLNLADGPRSQNTVRIDGITTEGHRTGTTESVEAKETRNAASENKNARQYPDTSVQEHLMLPRRRRKRPAPIMVRNQAKDGNFDWSDGSSSTASECDESVEAEMCKRQKHEDSDSVNMSRPTAKKLSRADSESEKGVHGTESSLHHRLQMHVQDKINPQRASRSDESVDPAHVVSKNDNSGIPGYVLSIKHETDLELRSMSYPETHSERHQQDENGTDSSDNVENDGMRSNNGEGWKILRIKEVLSEILCESSKANIARDLLLQKVSHVLQCPEVVHWGPACNRAVREEFPNSIAQRKGKFKKTYFFGVQFIEQTTDLGHITEAEAFSFQPLRDMSLDTEKILQYLPDLVCWTGDLESGVSRDELLHLLAEPIADSNVLVWGIECNRAVRKLYPEVHTKRKGKYKTTVFYGLSYLPHVRQDRVAQNFLKSRSGNFTEGSSCSLPYHPQDKDTSGIPLKNAQIDLPGSCEHAQMGFSESAPPSPVDLKVATPKEKQ
ncbi:uncharacterized protein LOC135480550 [Liolophura sinensis]|uniref:uncharacterized protein LOC135480550 n=1 Tax=Liolophura sinensis TaxID=3198878 RepID=UPI003157FDD2